MCTEKYAEKLSGRWKGLEDWYVEISRSALIRFKSFRQRLHTERVLLECQQAGTTEDTACFLSLLPRRGTLFPFASLSPAESYKKLFSQLKSSPRLHKQWWAFDSRTETIFVLKWESTNSINYRNELHLETTIQLPPTQINTFCS